MRRVLGFIVVLVMSVCVVTCGVTDSADQMTNRELLEVTAFLYSKSPEIMSNESMLMATYLIYEEYMHEKKTNTISTYSELQTSGFRIKGFLKVWYLTEESVRTDFIKWLDDEITDEEFATVLMDGIQKLLK